MQPLIAFFETSLNSSLLLRGQCGLHLKIMVAETVSFDEKVFLVCQYRLYAHLYYSVSSLNWWDHELIHVCFLLFAWYQYYVQGILHPLDSLFATAGSIWSYRVWRSQASVTQRASMPSRVQTLSLGVWVPLYDSTDAPVYRHDHLLSQSDSFDCKGGLIRGGNLDFFPDPLRGWLLLLLMSLSISEHCGSAKRRSLCSAWNQ